MTRPRYHFKFGPDFGEPEADAPEDDAGQVAHENRIEMARLLVDFVRLAADGRTSLSRLADSALVRRLYQANIRIDALAARVAACEARVVHSPDVRTMVELLRNSDR